MLATGFKIFPRPIGYDWHRIGGTHQISGAICPNCEKPLMLHLSLHTRDRRLNLHTRPFQRLPLLYCMRCELATSDFAYRVLSDSAIELIEYIPGDAMGDWEETGLGDAFPERGLDLEPLPSRFQRLCDLLNSGATLNDQDKAEFCKTSGRFARAEVGGYPIVGQINQLCGRAFLIQRLPDPIFRGEPFVFLASLCDDEMADLKFAPDGYQIVFWIGSQTQTILVQTSAD